MSLDGEQMDLAHSLAPPKSDADTCLRAFVLLVGAAAACAPRFSDEMDLGCDLPEDERYEWAMVTHLLMRLADRNTWGSRYAAGELASALRKLLAALPEEE